RRPDDGQQPGGIAPLLAEPRPGLLDSLIDLTAGIGVEALMFLLWAGMLVLLYFGIVLPSGRGLANFLQHPDDALRHPIPVTVSHLLAVVVMVLCGLPQVVTFCTAILVRQRSSERT